jgi:hypothetical protein
VEQWVVRVVGVVAFSAGGAVAAHASPPHPLPAWSLGSVVVYGLGVVLAVVVPLFVLLTFAIQTIVRGRVPTAISREGLTWPEELTTAAEAPIAKLRLELDALEAAVDEIAREVVVCREARP